MKLPKNRTLKNHPVVSRSEWLKSRRQLLRKEKLFSREREHLAEERRSLPWVLVEKPYRFDGPRGPESFADLFEGRRQLVIYHFMFDPRWTEGCAHCSFWADSFNDAIPHLNQRDVAMVAVSRAPLPKLVSFRKRMGWNFKWLSSHKSDFNHDFHVSFTDDQVKSKNAFYNYQVGPVVCREEPGISVFFMDPAGTIFHTYSCYARGIDMMNATYQYLDLVPKGRDEDPNHPQSWVDYHDRYVVSPKRNSG